MTSFTNFIGPLFTLIGAGFLTFLITFALLSRFNIFGEEKFFINLAIAAIVGIFFSISASLSKVMSIIIPWFALFFVILVVFITFLKLLGYSEGTGEFGLGTFFKENSMHWIFLLLMLGILGAGIYTVFGTRFNIIGEFSFEVAGVILIFVVIMAIISMVKEMK